MGLLDGLRQNLRMASENEQRTKDIILIKEMILDKLDLADIKLLCKRNNVGEPSNEEYDFWSSKTRKVRLVKKDYIKYTARNLDTDTIKEFARRKKINIDSILVEARHMESERTKWRENTDEMQSILKGKEGNFAEVISVIQKFEASRRYNEESYYQVELNGFLKHKF